MAMAAALFYFVTYAVHEEQKLGVANKARDAAVATLVETNDNIVAKLTEVFTQVIKNGEGQGQTVTEIKESLKGYVDPALVQKAIDAARKAVKATPGPSGPTGPTGAPGATGPPGAAAPTTSTAPAASTSTTRPPTTTTSSTTTTTRPGRPCVVRLAGLCV